MTVGRLGVGGSLVLLVSTGPLSLGVAQAQPDTTDTCITCHRALGVERLAGPVELFTDDIHRTTGFSCVSCHGGDATVMTPAAMDSALGFVRDIQPSQISQLCGRCHSDGQFMRNYNPSLRVDQVAEYATSVHGQRLDQYNDSLVATCVSCHPAHEIRPPSDPNSSVHPLQVAGTCGQCHGNVERMAVYAIPTNQRDEYEQSIHWEKLSVEQDLSAPTCNDCHGNHGAAPPGISWVGNTCGQCHAVMAEQYNGSPHARLFTLMGQPGCATCHGNHAIVEADDELLGLGEGAVCTQCHVEGVGGGVTAARMRALIDSLRTSVHVADSILAYAENAGVEVSQALFELEAAQTALVLARASIHSFTLDSVEARVGEGLAITTEAYEHGLDAVSEIRFRRTGLAVSSVIILLLLTGLILKIKSLDRETPAA